MSEGGEMKMAEVKDYGELFTADILVVGGSMSGLTTAIRSPLPG